MTTYFDNRAREVNDLRRALREQGDTSAVVDAVSDLDQAIVGDVTRCAEWPAKAGRRLACPVDIRLAIHRTLLLYSTAAQVSHKPAEWVCPDYADTDAELEGLATMIEKLHDIFHSLARRGIEGFNDSPLTPMGALDDDGAEAREKLAEDLRRGRAAGAQKGGV